MKKVIIQNLKKPSKIADSIKQRVLRGKLTPDQQLCVIIETPVLSSEFDLASLPASVREIKFKCLMASPSEVRCTACSEITVSVKELQLLPCTGSQALLQRDPGPIRRIQARRVSTCAHRGKRIPMCLDQVTELLGLLDIPALQSVDLSRLQIENVNERGFKVLSDMLAPVEGPVILCVSLSRGGVGEEEDDDAEGPAESAGSCDPAACRQSL